MKGKAGIRGRRSFATAAAVVAACFCLFLAGCGGGEDDATTTPPSASTTGGGVAQGGTTGASTAPGGNTLGGSTVEANAQRETLEDTPFVLNQDQPIPTDLRAAYQRKALIVVEFFKQGQDPYYPQGLEVDQYVTEDLTSLQAEYPQVEFFTYDISNPGDAETSEELERGEYGTLAAQLEVGFTPFIAMLAPQTEGDAYTIENLFQGYAEVGVLDQALFDLTTQEDGGNTSDVDLALGSVELTESGGGLEYFTVTNRSDTEVSLEGFSLRVMDPETAEISGVSDGGVAVDERLRLRPGETVSIGRARDLVDGDGRPVSGTFEGGDGLTLDPGVPLALVDPGGAVADTGSV